MKPKIMLLSVCLVFVWVTVANADMPPLVKLLFDDAAPTSTENLGSLGGTQQLPEQNGQKLSASPPLVNFDSGSYWSQAGAGTITYADYNLPEMSTVTVAFWYKSSGVAGWRNIFTGNGPNPFAAFDVGGTLQLYGPDDTMTPVSGALARNRWTHVAISYDPDGPTNIVNTQGALTVYLNGEPVTLNSWDHWGGMWAASEVGFTIGEEGATAPSFVGCLDNFFIFDIPLTQRAVQSLMTTNIVPYPDTCEEVKAYGFISTADLNGDCYVNLQDLAIIAGQWLECSSPNVMECDAPDSDWIDNTYGNQDVVLPGFDPLIADGNEAAMWCRVYDFNGSLMPEQITNQGVEMLMQPINWYLKSGATTYSLAAVSSTIVSSSPTRAVYETSGTLGGFTVSGTVLVEYDGFMKFDLQFDPGSTSVVADKLYMDIPFVPSSSPNMFHPLRRSGYWDNTWQSKLEYTSTNVITIGTPEISLQWLTESDQYYYPRESSTALETFDSGGAHVFRMNVINNQKTVGDSFDLTFALQAGPVKARPENWRAWTASPTLEAMNPTLYNNVSFGYTWWARGPGELVPRGGFPETPHKDVYEGVIDFTSIHFFGLRGYEQTRVSDRVPEVQRHEAEWLRVPGIHEEQGCPGWLNDYVDTNSSWRQWYVYNAYKLFSLTGMRGLYFDDWRAGSSMNEAAGSGYRDDEGILRATHPIFSQREIHRRVYTILKEFQPDDGVVIIHTSTATYLPVISFADMVYDGEILGWQDLAPPGGDYFKTWTNDLMQVIFQSKQYGPMPGFHDPSVNLVSVYPELVGPDILLLENQRKLWAIFLTHDIHAQFAASSGLENTHLYPWVNSFGISEPDVQFHPYWDANPAAEIIAGQEPESHLWAAAYSRPGKTLVIVVRDAPNNYTGSINIQVELDRTALGLPAGTLVCTSLESLGATSLGSVSGNILTVPVNASDFAGVIIQPE